MAEVHIVIKDDDIYDEKFTVEMRLINKDNLKGSDVLAMTDDILKFLTETYSVNRTDH